MRLRSRLYSTTKVDVKGKKVVCVLSGGNIDVSFIHKIVEKGLITRCRQLKFSVLMPDAPGALEHFSHIVAQQRCQYHPVPA